MSQTEGRIDINSVATPEYQEIAIMRQLCSEPEYRPPLTPLEVIGDLSALVLVLAFIAMFLFSCGSGSHRF
jgi:hypothetical protein